MLFLLIKKSKALLLLGLLSGPLWAQPQAPVAIYAAASLKDALDAILKTQGRLLHGTAKPVYAASSTLARQIEYGAPADVFIAADTDWMDYLAQRKLLLQGTRVNLLTNRLVLIVPAGSKAELAIAPQFPLAAALGGGRLALADPGSVPAGRYAKSALQALGVWDAVARQVAPMENVRAALLLVARSEAPFGIVYASDAVAETRVRVLGEFPARSHAPIVYAAAVLAQSRSAQARALLEHLRSDAALAVWRKYGFGVAD